MPKIINKILGTPEVSNSQVAQKVAENMNLGQVIDSTLPSAVAQTIKEKALSSVIQYEGGNETFIWKHPLEDFNTGSTLIVHESQEAVLFMNGQALDLFAAGRHTLETQNLPLIGKFFSAPTGGQTPFHCEIYFINKTEQLAIKWGTDSKLEYVEPQYGFPIQIGASGEMSLRVEDSRKLLIKVVGTERGISQQAFVQKMRAFLTARLKQYLAAYIKSHKINIFEIDERLTEISADLLAQFAPEFADYGVSLEKFFVTTIVKPEEDGNYKRFKELHFRKYADVAEARLRQETGLIEQETQAQRMVIEAQGIAQKRALEGYTYQDERGFDVAERVAANEATGQLTNLGIGMGMITGIGGTVGGAVGGILQNTLGGQIGQPTVATGGTAAPPIATTGGTSATSTDKSTETKPCSHCGNILPATAKFCPECGEKTISESEIICPDCGEKTIKGKFCIECGAALSKNCPHCDAPLTGGKFCAECGQKI